MISHFTKARRTPPSLLFPSLAETNWPKRPKNSLSQTATWTQGDSTTSEHQSRSFRWRLWQRGWLETPRTQSVAFKIWLKPCCYLTDRRTKQLPWLLEHPKNVNRTRGRAAEGGVLCVCECVHVCGGQPSLCKLTNRRLLCRPASCRGRCGPAGCSRCWWRRLPCTWRRSRPSLRQSCSRGIDPSVWSSRRSLWRRRPRTLRSRKTAVKDGRRDKWTDAAVLQLQQLIYHF